MALVAMMHARRAFTLMELLVVLLITAVLVSLVFGSMRAVRQKADVVQGQNIMRQTGIAILQFAADHDQRLPGPLWPGQIPIYDPNREGRLVRELREYLDLPAYLIPTLVSSWVPRAYPQVPGEPRVFVMNMSVRSPDGSKVKPWGSLTGPRAEPANALQIDEPSKTAVMSDADQLHPWVKNAPWSASTPKQPIHGDARNWLFFDGHVERVPVE